MCCSTIVRRWPLIRNAKTITLLRCRIVFWSRISTKMVGISAVRSCWQGGGEEFRFFDFQNADRLVSVVLNCFDGLGQCFVDAFQYEPGRNLIHEINILGLTNHCAMRRILAISAQNIELLGVRFQSLASRRHLPSHVKVRSTIHHLGRRVNPMAPCGRLTISRFQHLARKAYPKISSCSKTGLWQVVDVEPMPVFGKFYNG